jgi:hypothetical protein
MRITVLLLTMTMLLGCFQRTVSDREEELGDENLPGETEEDCVGDECGEPKDLPGDQPAAVCDLTVTAAATVQGNGDQDEMRVSGTYPQGLAAFANQSDVTIGWGAQQVTIPAGDFSGAAGNYSVVFEDVVEATVSAGGACDIESEAFNLAFPDSQSFRLTVGAESCAVTLSFDGSGNPTTPGVAVHPDDP